MNINAINTVSSSADVSGVNPGLTVVKNTAAKPEKVEKPEPIDSRQGQADGREKEDPSLNAAVEMAETLNEYMNDLQTNIGFYIREDLGHQVVVEIKNRETDELIKQIPTEEMLKIKEKMEELTGLIFDTRA